MYRAYQPLFPAASRYLQEKWDKTNYQEHRRKVELATPVVDTAALPMPLHLQVNLKKLQLEKERKAARDRDNLLHYARLRSIKQSRGRVDNWNFYCRHSLNWEKRQRDLEQIYWENQQLMKRLAERKSELAPGHWQPDGHRERLIHSSFTRQEQNDRGRELGAIAVPLQHAEGGPTVLPTEPASQVAQEPVWWARDSGEAEMNLPWKGR